MVAPRNILRRITHVFNQFILPFIIGVMIAIAIILFHSKRKIAAVEGMENTDLSAEEKKSKMPRIITADNPLITQPQDSNNDSTTGALVRDGGGEVTEERIKEEPDLTKFQDTLNDDPPALNVTRQVSPEELELIKKRRKERAEKAARGSWTCRHRWTKWLKQNTYYIPPELDKLFGRYNRLHDKLLRDLPIEEAFRTSLTSVKNVVGYVVWRPVGNDHAGRLLSLISAYLLALLTDRVLLVNFPYVNYLLCEPFTRSSWIFPQKRLGDLNKFTVMRKALQIQSPIRIARLKLDENFMNDDSIFLTCNGNVKHMLSHVQMILVESPVGFAELLAFNPSHHKRMDDLFQGRSIYGALMHNLLHPANDMWFRLIDAYHIQYTNDFDRPQRLAVYIPPSNDAQPRNHILKHQGRCALEELSGASFDKHGKIIYYSPSSPLNNSKSRAKNIFSQQVITATDLNMKRDLLGQWRRLFTDIWMTSWANAFAVTKLDQSSLVAHYYRGQASVLLSEEVGEVVEGEEGKGDGKCQNTAIPPEYLTPLKSHITDCPSFRQAWRSKHKISATERSSIVDSSEHINDLDSDTDNVKVANNDVDAVVDTIVTAQDQL